jgi:SAM-dependent methyltransferase
LSDPGTESYEHLIDYDAELRLHNHHLREAYGIRRTDRVLDIGCGAGQTTRDAAGMAGAGRAHGVDSSAVMIRRARELSRAEGLRNITFQHCNAESARFHSEPFDIAISRFGTMFFTDPETAFVNIARALRTGARLVMMVWQHYDRNEWAVTIDQALGRDLSIRPRGRDAPDPFSLADPTKVRGILGSAGFTELTFTDINESVFYGPDVGAASKFVSAFQSTQDCLGELDRDSAEAALDRLRQTLGDHQTEEGVVFDSFSWIITARRR